MPDPTPHEPSDETRKKVENYAAVGIPQEDIAKVIGIDKKTLVKYYRSELDVSMVKANAAIGGALYKKAMDGDTTAMIWWTKARMLWKETKNEERRYVDKDGEDLHTKDKELLKKMGIE